MARKPIPLWRRFVFGMLLGIAIVVLLQLLLRLMS
jgi:hypothetical protein